MTRDDRITAALDELGRRLRRARKAKTKDERVEIFQGEGLCPLCKATGASCKPCPARYTKLNYPCHAGYISGQAGDMDTYAWALRETRRRWRVYKSKGKR